MYTKLFDHYLKCHDESSRHASNLPLFTWYYAFRCMKRTVQIQSSSFIKDNKGKFAQCCIRRFELQNNREGR